jgi:hypothetical protein
MTVKELIEELKKEDPKRLVVIQRDAEGNGYSPLTGWWLAAYKAENDWSGETGLEKLTAEDRKQGYTKEDVLKGGVPALILCPIN